MRGKKYGKKVVAAVTAAAMAVALIVSPTAEAAGKGVKLSKKKLTVRTGASASLKVTGKKISSVKWKSSNSKIAKVKKKGKKVAAIKGKKAGKTKIKVTVKQKGSKKKVLTCTVTVKGKATEETPGTVTPTPVPAQTSTTAPAPQRSASASAPASEAPATPAISPTLQPLDTIPENELALCSYPTLWSDVPDPYICRKGDTYYMVSTTMFLNPGAPIMKSKDLVHWQTVGYVYDQLADDDFGNMDNGKDMYSHGSWAAALSYNEEEDRFYVCFNTHDEGCFFFTTDNIEEGNWKRYKSERAYHDPGLLFEDGNMYVFYTYGQCDMAQVKLEEDDDGDGVGKAVQVGSSRTLIKSENFSGTEGWHAYHIGDYYYLLSIGSPNGKWFRTEICYRTKDLQNGEWEEQVVYSGPSGGFTVQGLAQGGIIDTVYGEWYGYLFQDRGSLGRCPSIVEVNWNYTDEEGNNYKDWPMMGTYDADGVFHAGVSEDPIRIHLKDSGENSYIWGDDDFTYEEGEPLKQIWQWNHNPEPENWSVTENPGYYRIRSGRIVKNVYGAKNSLTQRTYGPECVSETKINVAGLKPGDYAGLCAFQDTYGIIGVTCDAEGKKYLVQGQGKFNEQSDGYYDKEPITENERAGTPLASDEVTVKIEYDFSHTATYQTDMAEFYYSLDDGKTWAKLGKSLKLTNNYQTVFMGARSYLFMYSTEQTGGYADFDYYKIYD